MKKIKESIATKKECLAICKAMMEGLGGKWKSQAHDISSSVVRDTDWYAIISNGEVYIIHNPSDGSYSAAYEGVNFEHESWNGRTPKEALSKLVKAHERSIQRMKDELAELKEEIPEAEVEHERMKTWLKR